MRSATKVTVSTFGALAGLAGIEHGIGEILQGKVAPDGLMFLSWPDSELFEILAGEPAMTIVANLLATGILAILVSLVFLVWATMFIGRKHGGLVLILLSVALLLVGGGFGPPILGVIVGVAATRINAPLAWWRTHLSDGARRLLATVWSPCLVAGVTAWLLVMRRATRPEGENYRVVGDTSHALISVLRLHLRRRPLMKEEMMNALLIQPIISTNCFMIDLKTSAPSD